MGELCKYLKEDLNIESISIVSNGSKIKESWFKKYGQYVNILAVSCDSFNEEINEKIGRFDGKRACQYEYVKNAAMLCKKYNIKEFPAQINFRTRKKMPKINEIFILCFII